MLLFSVSDRSIYKDFTYYERDDGLHTSAHANAAFGHGRRDIWRLPGRIQKTGHIFAPPSRHTCQFYISAQKEEQGQYYHAIVTPGRR